MNIRFGHIMDRLNDLVTFRADRSMSDEDFIAGIDAVNLLCNLQDDLGLDRTGIRRKMDALYPQFLRRIKGKENIQHAMPLIKALYRYIYDRTPGNADRGPANRRKSFIDMCGKVVAAYRENPLIHSSGYLYALCAVARSRDYVERSEYEEINDIIVSYLHDMDSATTEEKLLRLTAYNASGEFIRPENNHREKWAEIRDSLKDKDVRELDDEAFVMWCDATDRMPVSELRKRAGNSNRMQVEYLHALAASEFERIRREKARRKLNRDLKTLKDDLIVDIIPLKIDAGMSVSTLYALETNFYLRLQLAQVSWDENEPIYESLCRNRFEQIARALTKKYKTAESLNEKIEILERLVTIGMTINSDHLNFALDEASSLEDLPDLTYAQKLRLEWLPNINTEDCDAVVDKLLSFISGGDEESDIFIMGTIGRIIDYITPENRALVLDRYEALVNAAIAANDTAELGNLLALTAYWNSNPTVRHRLSEIVSNAALVEDIPLPEKRVNAIAAEIYSRIDAITGKYRNYDMLGLIS